MRPYMAEPLPAGGGWRITGPEYDCVSDGRLDMQMNDAYEAGEAGAEAEVARLKALLPAAFDAGAAWAVRSHRDFVQTHPGREEWVQVALAEEVARLKAELAAAREALERLPKTGDGKPYIPTVDDLWQIDPEGFINDGHPWRAKWGTAYHHPNRPVYLSADNARAALAKPEQEGGR